MRQRTQSIEVFGLSFLDMISCGLGGVLVLMLIVASLAESGGGRVAAVPASSESVAPEPTPFFHLGIVCSGHVTKDFALEVASRELPALDAARRFEVRRDRDSKHASLSVLQRGWKSGCLRVDVGTPSAMGDLFQPLRGVTETYRGRPGATTFDRGLGAELLELLGQLELSGDRQAWSATVDTIRHKLEECSHNQEKAPVVREFEQLTGAWLAQKERLELTPRCLLELATAVDVQIGERFTPGSGQSCVAAKDGDYLLVVDCDESCGGIA